MIRVLRNRSDSNTGNPIRPPDDWYCKANTEKQKALREKENHKVDSTVCADNDLREALEELFYQKCAYCESDLRRVEWEVEHFRPKGRVRERHDHPGYYWLACEWKNLYPSCTFCNQHRKEKPRWGVPATGVKGGKADQFPLLDESTRAMDHTDEIGREKRLLLDPCRDLPERHFCYDPDGQIRMRGDRAKGRTSIGVFMLDLTRLNEAREEIINIVVNLLEVINKSYVKGDRMSSAGLSKILKDCYLGDRCRYAGAARFVVNNPEVFGLCGIDRRVR